MSCPHGLYSQPASCSQCLGATPRVVHQEGDRLLIDGVDVRAINVADDHARNYYARRGGQAHHQGRKPKP